MYIISFQLQIARFMGPTCGPHVGPMNFAIWVDALTGSVSSLHGTGHKLVLCLRVLWHLVLGHQWEHCWPQWYISLARFRETPQHSENWLRAPTDSIIGPQGICWKRFVMCFLDDQMTQFGKTIMAMKGAFKCSQRHIAFLNLEMEEIFISEYIFH